MFEIHIDLGNATMKSAYDVMSALRAVINRLSRGEESGKVMDENGNTVGSWEIEFPEADDK